MAKMGIEGCKWTAQLEREETKKKGSHMNATDYGLEAPAAMG